MTGAIALAGHALQLNTNTSISLGAISGVGGVTLGGTGVAFFGGAASYTGDTNVNGGTLALTAGSSSSGSNITVNNGTLSGQGGSISVQNPSVINFYKTLTLGSADNSTANATFIGSAVSVASYTAASGNNTTSASIQYDQNLTVLSAFTLASGSGSVASYALLNDASLSANAAYIGEGGNGSLSLGAGNASFEFVELGIASGSNGTFTIGTGNMTVSTMYIGGGGTGLLTQNGGTVSVGSRIVLGDTGIGNYVMTNGTLSAPSLTVGLSGTANYTQSGGTATITNINIGTSGPGAVTLSGNSTLTAGTINVGSGGTGSMVQNNGNVTVTTRLAVGGGSSALVGSYTINGGQLSAALLAVGYTSSGTFTQNGGNVSLTADLQLLSNVSYAFATASYALNGGILMVPAIDNVPNTGATLALNGGTLTASGGSTAFIPAAVNVLVRGGGAIVDTGGFSDTILAAVAHDSTLGSAADGGITKRGNGTLTLAGNVFVNGGTSIAAGTLVFAGASSIINGVMGAGTLGVGGNGSLQAASIVLPSVSVAVGGNLTLVGGTSKVGALTLSGGSGNWTSAVALQYEKLILEPSAAGKAAALSTVRDQVAFGLTHGTGILDYFLPAHAAVAVIDNATLAVPLTTFGGMAVDANSILVAPELLGDANVDGHVDFSDLNIVLNHLGATTSNWTAGNFDGAATIDLNDLNAVLNGLGTSFSGSTSVVESESLEPAAAPEPCTGMMVLAVGSLLLRRTTRRLAR